MKKQQFLCTHEFLSRYVTSYTLLEFDDSNEAETIKVPPLGFPVIHFQYGDSTDFYNQDKLKHDSLIVGQLSGHYLLRPVKGTKLIGIDFKPYGFYNLFRFPMHTIANTAIPADAFFERQLVGKVINALQNSPTFCGKIEIIENFLRETARGKQPLKHSLFDDLVDMTIEKSGLLKVEDLLTEKVRLRNLQRYFKEHIGIPPKLFFQILRHKFVLQAMYVKPEFSWRDPILDGYYYDQSHFDRDFVKFSSEKPREYLQIDHILARKLV